MLDDVVECRPCISACVGSCVHRSSIVTDPRIKYVTEIVALLDDVRAVCTSAVLDHGSAPVDRRGRDAHAVGLSGCMRKTRCTRHATEWHGRHACSRISARVPEHTRPLRGSRSPKPQQPAPHAKTDNNAHLQLYQSALGQAGTLRPWVPSSPSMQRAPPVPRVYLRMSEIVRSSSSCRLRMAFRIGAAQSARSGKCFS